MGLQDPTKDLIFWKSLNKWCNDDEGDSKLFVLKIPRVFFKQMHIIGKLVHDLAYLAGDQNTLFL